MVLANDINDRLDTPLSVFWPTYENTGINVHDDLAYEGEDHD